MAEISKETVTTHSNASPADSTTTRNTTIKRSASSSQTIEYFTYFLSGILEILLVFRLILKLTGASTASGFVNFIYSVTGIFVLPFEGIFRRGFAQGAETTAVFEPSTLVALLVYAVLTWGIVMLIRILSGQQQAE